MTDHDTGTGTGKQVFSDPFHFLAFGFGSGLSPKAPGTAGTLVAVPFAWLLVMLPWTVHLAVVIAAFGAGVYLCERVASEVGDTDPPGIVFDEFVGFWLTCLFLPEGWWWLVVAFVLFRICDILKPWPVSLSDRAVKGGLGIMLDDVVAGLYALAGVQMGAYLTRGLVS